MRTVSILVAEDDETDVLLLKRAFQKAELIHPVDFVADGLAAIEALSASRTQPDKHLPGLVLLDLKMPRRNGLQVLQWMRLEPVVCAIPTLIFSSSSNQSDIESAYEAGASGFMIKPPSSAERMEVAHFIRNWMKLIQPPLAATDGIKAAFAFRFGNGTARPTRSE